MRVTRRGSLVTPADHYRALAARFRAHARAADSPRLAAEWEHLARCYIRLAQQAEQNLALDVVYETPTRPHKASPPDKP
jgi:hypothetical protein